MEDKTKDLGIHRDPSDEATADEAADINESGGVHNCDCCGSECHIEWTDD